LLAISACWLLVHLASTVMPDLAFNPNKIKRAQRLKKPKILTPDRIGSTVVRVSALTVKNADVRPRVRFPLGAEQVKDAVLADRTANT